MDERDQTRQLFLAIPEEVYKTFFLDTDIQAICAHFHLKIIVYDSVQAEIKSWIIK